MDHSNALVAQLKERLRGSQQDLASGEGAQAQQLLELEVLTLQGSLPVCEFLT